MSSSYTRVHSYYHAHRLTLAGISEEAFTRSLTSARVEMNPHQVDAALFALKSPLAKGVLLADEVGLGKTIEAGLVISQRWAEHKRRILLVVPASLRKQWEQELWEKFSIHGVILEAATLKEQLKRGIRRPFEEAKGVVIVSYEFAARRAEDLKIAKWDLVVFDEAHRLRNVYRKGGSQRAKDLKAALSDPFKILLTATPLQNSLLELYGIISVIDEAHFGGEKAFKAQYTGANATPASLDVLRDRLESICHRTLRRQVQEAGHINFRRREARTFSFDPSASEIELYEGISDFLKRRDTISYGDKPNQLVILQVRKILGSSTFAVARYLETLIERLRLKQRAAIDMTEDVEDMSIAVEEADTDEAQEADEPIDPLKLAAEIIVIENLLHLAKSIGSNAKGEKLIAQLPEVLDQIESKGGKRKAVVFTESVRTQKYLHGLLSANDYAGKIVLLNGSNNDEESKQIYADWRELHAGTDKLSGSRSADMKAAIVDAFRDDARTIMISTESGAEGINLQFCSLVVNYDLPWNPQRVEQRIGRCHRYGQKIDVTVVNMLNLKNQTEQRIHQLLSEKFHLFSGVFGASDEVLGTLMSGLDFEKEVVRIVQECRTEEEAEAEFDVLTARIQDKIDADIADARSKVLETMDGEVITKLQRRGQALSISIPEFKQRLLMVAHGELPAAVFPDPGSERFEYDGETYTTAWPVADENDWQFLRVNEGLGEQIVRQAKSSDAAQAAVQLTFDPAAYPFPGQLAAAKDLAGQSGWLRVIKALMPTADAAREELLIACVTDGGTPIETAVADKLLMTPSSPPTTPTTPCPEQELADFAESEARGFGERVKNENFAWVQAEEERLDRYAADIEIELDAQIADLELEIKELQKQRRAPDLSMEDKLGLSRSVKRMEGDLDDLKLSKFEQRRKVRREVADRLDAFADSLNRAATFTSLMTVRWTVA